MTGCKIRCALAEDIPFDLCLDPGIIRHRGKIVSTLNNAKRAIEVQREFGSLAAYIWRFEPRPAHRPDRLTAEALKAMVETDASRALSKDLRKRGFSFVGPTSGDWWIRLASRPLMPTSPGTFPGQRSTTSGSAAEVGAGTESKTSSAKTRAIRRMRATPGRLMGHAGPTVDLRMTC